jgi:hypothetical protein
MLDGEGEKIIPEDTILAAGQSERSQVTLLDPSQNCYFTYAAMPGNGAGS